MAGKKGRSGRPKGSKTKKTTARPRPVQVAATPAPVMENPPAPATESLTDKLQDLFKQAVPADPGEIPSAASPSATTPKNTSAFEQTASRLESDYGPAQEPTGQEPEGGAAPQPEQEVIPPPAPSVQVIRPETMERVLRSIFDGLEKVHGERWKVSESDLVWLVPVNCEMVNEQVPKLGWFRESQNKALWIWALSMAAFIGSRSEAGEKLMTWITGKAAEWFGEKKSSGASAGS